MKVLLIGCGKMGSFICGILRDSPRVNELYVYDISIEQSYDDAGTHFIAECTDALISSVDAVFIATPATTHFEIIKRLINSGVKNIYVEKPAVVFKDEFEKIAAIKGDCKIVCGYILRQSVPLIKMRGVLKKMYEDGFRLELCSVTYQKNLPFSSEERTKTDMGVYEEIVHIWDLLFNYLGLSEAERKTVDSLVEFDPGRPDRANFIKLCYYLRSDDCKAIVNIKSSFRANERKREFYFEFKEKNGSRRHVYLSFDNPDNTDRVVVTDKDGNILYSESYPALLKLDHQINEVFDFFEKGEKADLAMFEESEIIIDFLAELGVNV